jgi:CRISPR-associated protein Cas2
MSRLWPGGEPIANGEWRIANGEMKVLLVYDITDDRVRGKVADFCLDYGLDRIQYSAFMGELSRNHQEELMLKVEERLGDQAGKIQLYPICDKDWRARLEIIQEREDDDDG